MPDPLSERAASHLRRLCVEIPTRRVGTAGNRAATDYAAATLAALGWETTSPPFDCLDWAEEGATLAVGGSTFPVLVSPYSLGGHFRAPLAVVATVDELAAAGREQMILLHGEIAKEQLMPKNFPFYNPEAHQAIYELVEGKRPRAVVAATSRNPEMAGAMYPFPLFYDGDFDIPSVYTTAEEGARLAALAGQPAALTIRAERRPATGCNVEARRGANPARRIVCFAHIDAAIGTPGAVDNAAGAAVLLLLAELLAGYRGELSIELVALNGEDDYSAAGEKLWLRQNEGRLGEIALGINLDAVGFHQGRTAYSLYSCPPAVEAAARAAFGAQEGTMEGPPWYQSDHSLFIQNGVPALAVTSEGVAEILGTVAHTEKDHIGVVDPARMARAALALRDLALSLDGLG